MSRDNELKIRVLIADDHAITRLGLESALSAFDELSIVGNAKNGTEAIECCATLAPHVVLMDVRMPELNGIDSTRAIKESYESIRILMLTEADHEEEVFASFAAGADGYCLKRAPADQLRTAIKSVHNGVGWIDPAVAKQVLLAIAATATQNVPAVQPKLLKFGLSSRELEVLQCIVDGCANNEIANKLVISTETVKTHVRHIMDKLSVSDRTQACVKALREGILDGHEHR